MWISFLSKMSMKKGRPPIKVKRPRQPAVRHKAGPLALLNFVVNKTASFFLYSFRQFSTWKRNWIKDDKRSNPLKIKAFSVCRYYTVTALPCQPFDWDGMPAASDCWPFRAWKNTDNLKLLTVICIQTNKPKSHNSLKILSTEQQSQIVAKWQM